LLDSVGDELRQLGLDKVCRVDDFVAPVWQGASVAALVLAPGLSLGLGLAGDGAAVMQDWYEQDLAACNSGADCRSARNGAVRRI
jgi:hypothetical protein